MVLDQERGVQRHRQHGADHIVDARHGSQVPTGLPVLAVACLMWGAAERRSNAGFADIAATPDSAGVSCMSATVLDRFAVPGSLTGLACGEGCDRGER